MKILVTGSAGRIGRHVAAALREAGHDLRTFDRHASTEPDNWPGNVLDPMEVRRAVQGCECVVHLAAVPNDREGAEDDVVTTNVLGTWNVLQGAAEAGVRRAVFFSSIQVFGLTATQRKPDYLPLDDAHPHYPVRPYSLTKNVGEQMCSYFTESAGMSTLILRPTYVADAEAFTWWNLAEGRRPARYHRYTASDFWSYVDMADVARAAVLAVAAEGIRHGAYLLAAADTTSAEPTAELLREFYPDVPLRLPEGALDADPHCGLIDTTAAERDLGWRPQRSWRDVVEG